jgi:hypothetical protein
MLLGLICRLSPVRMSKVIFRQSTCFNQVRMYDEETRGETKDHFLVRGSTYSLTHRTGARSKEFRAPSCREDSMVSCNPNYTRT